MRRREFIKGIVGSATACPFAAHALQPKLPVIGFLSARTAADSASVEGAFRKGLNDAGYVDGRDIQITHQWADGEIDRLPALASELIEKRVVVIVAADCDAAALAAKAATSAIPIVFVGGHDHVMSRLVSSPKRPDSNVTGVALYRHMWEGEGGLLDLLREVVPKQTRIGVLGNWVFPSWLSRLSGGVMQRDPSIAEKWLRGKYPAIFPSTEAEIDSAFDTFRQMKINALAIGSNGFSDQGDQLIKLAKHAVKLAKLHAWPAIYHSRALAEAGGLMSHGVSFTDAYRQAGRYTGRILSGARPADLPIAHPDKDELVINVRMARALGLTVPRTLLARADEVIA